MDLDGVSFGHDVCNKVFFFASNTSSTYMCSCISIPYYQGIALHCEDDKHGQQVSTIAS